MNIGQIAKICALLIMAKISVFFPMFFYWVGIKQGMSADIFVTYLLLPFAPAVAIAGIFWFIVGKRCNTVIAAEVDLKEVIIVVFGFYYVVEGIRDLSFIASEWFLDPGMADIAYGSMEKYYQMGVAFISLGIGLGVLFYRKRICSLISL